MSTDPTAIAREVLDLAHEDETVTVCSIPDNKATTLARAVLAVAALADQLDAEGDQLQRTGRLPDVPAGMERQAVAARIRAALNEETPR